ncbi:MAG TPA: hypothetical protein VN916_05855 [Candidatus Acidoferrum sp.]|nr:hypothetical protein [Candidatus Acidoferrum sp.]
MAGENVDAVVVDVVRVYLRDQECVYQDRDENHGDEEVASRLRLLGLTCLIVPQVH